jgi:hypothetical protein
MTDRVFLTDAATTRLEYVGDTDIDGEDVVIDELETTQLETQWSAFFGTDEFVQFSATVAQPIKQLYVHDGELKTFRKDESELKTAQPQLDNLPWTMDHPPGDRVTSTTEIRGVWTDPYWEDGQQATLNLPTNDPEAIRFALDNNEVSVGFSAELDFSDDDADAVQRDMVYDHVASVESGRCSTEDGCGIQATEMTAAADSAAQSAHGHVYTDGLRTKNTEESAMDESMDPTYSEGDWVRWEWSGGSAVGQVRSVHTDGPVSVDGTERDPSEEGEPVYKIRHFDDGSWGNLKIAYESNLSDASEPETYTDGRHICTPGPCSCGCHDPLIDVDVNGTDIDLVPPEAVQNHAQDALDARADDDVTVNGMTDHGWSRAEQLASGEELSPSDIVGGSGAMAPWWSRHESHTVDGDSLAGTDKENPWSDNSYTAGKGWGGIEGMEWAYRKGNQIKKARGENPVYGDSDIFTDAPDGIYTEDGDWYGIAPAENDDGEPKYDLNNCNDVKDAYNLRGSGEYDIDESTLVARIKRASAAHDCPPEQKPWVDDETDSSPTSGTAEKLAHFIANT